MQPTRTEQRTDKNTQPVKPAPRVAPTKQQTLPSFVLDDEEPGIVRSID